MKERPILFNGPMVRAILAGRKTQTRRVVKLRKLFSRDDFVPQCAHPTANGDGWIFWSDAVDAEWTKKLYPSGGIPCPYGMPGDRLWVRETWCHYDDWLYIYKATPPDWAHSSVWCPSIHMPRDACRLTLEATAIRVERLQDISEEDAKAEGVERAKEDHIPLESYRMGFELLWDSINAKRGFGWDANPWVWVIEFRRVENA